MAYTTINKSTDYFNTKLYTGNGGTQSITGVGFQSDFTWIKRRDTTNNHRVTDAIRGVTKEIYPDDNSAQDTRTNGLTAFGSDGFTVGDSAGYNANSGTYASWNWKANGAGSANTDGSRTTTVSVNTTAGFSVGTCSSLATNNDTLGHGLGAVPKMIIVKNTQGAGSWWVYHASLGNTNRVYLNGTEASGSSTIWNNTTPTSSVFTIKGGDFATGESLVFYAFAEKTGYSKFGSFTGNGNANGPFIYTGFKPAFVIVKITSTSNNWNMFDDKRPGFNEITLRHFPNLNNAEQDGSAAVDFVSNGFKFRNTNDNYNASGASYIYMAFGQSLVGTNGVTAKAR